MRVGPKFSGLTYKSRANWKMLRGLYSAIYGEANVSISICVEIEGDYAEKQQSCFVSVTLKSRSGWKLLDPPSYIFLIKVLRPGVSSLSSPTSVALLSLESIAYQTIAAKELLSCEMSSSQNGDDERRVYCDVASCRRR